ncbi:MAG TPA: NADH-quinone oxidoreductase subunit C [Terracidiphilus sp.]|jgi:NADH:ubiquinone oxidoreductase subunit C
MTTLELIPEATAETSPWTEEGGVFWLNYSDLNVREVANAMNALQARFITVTAYQLPKEEGLRLEYHWDIDGRLLGFVFTLASKSIESIYDLCEAADWIEREIHEGFAVDFTGRVYEPLLLRSGDMMGVNLREICSPEPPAAGSVGKEEVAK